MASLQYNMQQRESFMPPHVLSVKYCNKKKKYFWCTIGLQSLSGSLSKQPPLCLTIPGSQAYWVCVEGCGCIWVIGSVFGVGLFHLTPPQGLSVDTQALREFLAWGLTCLAYWAFIRLLATAAVTPRHLGDCKYCGSGRWPMPKIGGVFSVSFVLHFFLVGVIPVTNLNNIIHMCDHISES